MTEQTRALTPEEAAWREADWEAFAAEYADTSERTRHRERLAFYGGWDARHLSPRLTAAQQEAVDSVRSMVEASTHVAASITDALYTDARDRAEQDIIEAATPLQREALAEARTALAAAQETTAEVPAGYAAPDTAEPPACTCATPLPENGTPAPCPMHGWTVEPDDIDKRRALAEDAAGAPARTPEGQA